MNSIGNQDSRIIVGLDIGSKKIKCAIGKIQEDRKRVNLLGFSEIESSGIKKGIIINRDELIDKIEQVINNAEIMADVKATTLTLSITGEHIKCLNTQAAISLNYTSGITNGSRERIINKDDILQVLNSSQSISLPIDRDILHTIPQEYSVDTLEEIKSPLGMTGRRLESKVHLITAASTAMNNFVSCVEELGLSVDGLVFQPIASSLSTLKKDEMELGITLVDLGYTTTNIAVYHKGSIRHSGIIPIGSKSITNDIAVMLQIGLEESEKIKIKYASALASMSSSELNINISNIGDEKKRSVSENEISKYVEARMQEIFQMVIQEISRADVKDPLTYGIVLTGGGASLRNLIPLLENSLGVKVRLGKPTKIDGAKDIADGPSYATSMGLLLWSLYDIDYSHLQNNQDKGFIGIIKKIRDTIENMF